MANNPTTVPKTYWESALSNNDRHHHDRILHWLDKTRFECGNVGHSTRFNERERKILEQANCPPLTAYQYSLKLNGEEVAELFLKGVGPEEATAGHFSRDSSYCRGVIDGYVLVSSRYGHNAHRPVNNVPQRKIREFIFGIDPDLIKEYPDLPEKILKIRKKLKFLSRSEEVNIPETSAIDDVVGCWKQNNPEFRKDWTILEVLDEVISSTSTSNDAKYLRGKIVGARVADNYHYSKGTEELQIVAWALTQLLGSREDAPARLKSCTTIDSKKYLILGHLGDGRQGDVYAAYHKQVNVRRAIKIIPGRQDCGEAAAIGLLEHSPHRSIAKIIDFDNHTVTINGEPVNAVTLEYIEGQNLEEFISHQTSSRRGDAEGVAVQIAGQLVDAVEHLLKQGIRHRDIRPANIKLMAGTTSSNLDVKLIDFGASTDGLDDGEKDNTRFGGQSDLNSIGQIIYHFCSRQNIFNATGKPDADVKQDIKEYRTSLIGRGEVRRLNPLLRRNIREWPLRQFIRDCLSATGKIEDDLALIKTLRSDLKSTQKFIKWRRDRPRRLKELGVICLASVTLAGGYHVASELFPHKETQQMVRQSSSERLQKDITSSYKSPDFIREKMLKDAERNYADLTIEDRRKLYREMIDIERALGSYDKVAEYYTKMISITTGKMEKLTLIGSRAELYDKYLKDAKRALADYEQALSLLPEAAAETHKGFDRENEKIRRYLEDKVELFRTINSMISAPARH